MSDEMNVKLSQEEVEIKEGKVIIENDALKEQLEGMNIVGDEILGEEGSNAISVTITIGK